MLSGPSSSSNAVAVPLMPREYVHPGMSAPQIGSILWAYWPWTLLIAGTVVVLVAVATLVWPRTYVSTAALMVNFEVNDPLGGRDFPVGLLGSYMATQVELARGSEVLQPVIQRQNLAASEEYTNGYSGDPDGLTDWIETRVRKKLQVGQGLYGSQLIHVTYSASSAGEAASVANAVAEVYSEQQYQRLTGPANDRAQRYTEQLAGLKNKVTLAQDAVTGFRRSSGLIDSDAKNDVDLQVLSNLEQRLLDAQSARRGAQARVSANQTFGSQVLGSNTVQSLKAQLATQGAQMAELQGSLGERHPQLLALQSQMQVTRQSLDAEMGAYAGNANAELRAASQLEAQLQTSVEEARAGVIRVRQLQDDGAKYELELESAQSVYKRALDGYDQIMFASGGGYTNINFISRATPPPKAASPNVIVALFFACVFGGALGLALPFLYEMLNRRVRCRDDLERDHGIPVLVELGPIGPVAPLSLRGAT